MHYRVQAQAWFGFSWDLAWLGLWQLAAVVMWLWLLRCCSYSNKGFGFYILYSFRRRLIVFFVYVVGWCQIMDSQVETNMPKKYLPPFTCHIWLYRVIGKHILSNISENQPIWMKIDRFIAQSLWIELKLTSPLTFFTNLSHHALLAVARHFKTFCEGIFQKFQKTSPRGAF